MFTMNDTGSSYCVPSDGRVLAVMRQILNVSNGSNGRSGTGQAEAMLNAMLVLYLTTFVFGILGNTVTIYALVRTKHLRSVANCFILNLAVADDLFLSGLPFIAHSSYTRTWMFGAALCKVMTVFRGVNLYASIFTMTLMSIDRYLAVVHPFDSLKYRTRRNALAVCAVVWAVCLVIMTPLWMYSAVDARAQGASACRICWPRGRIVEHIWMWANFELVVGFVAPIAVMAVCYARLLRRLLVQPAVRRQQGGGGGRSQAWRVTGMLFVVTVVFLVCWAPHHVMRLIAAYKNLTILDGGWERTNATAHIVANIVAQALPFVSSCCNPFIYYITSRNFRQIYKTVLCTCSSTMPLANYGSVSRSSGLFHSQKLSHRKSGGRPGSECAPPSASLRKHEARPDNHAETCELKAFETVELNVTHE